MAMTQRSPIAIARILAPSLLFGIAIWQALTGSAIGLHFNRQNLPPGKLGDVIKLGKDVVHDTVNHPLSRDYIGNKLNCTSCHLENGTHPQAGTFLGTATAYPAWSPREKRVITLEDRILNCFMRSCNGKRPPLGSDVSVAIAAYITWLSHDMPIKMNPDRPSGPNFVRPLDVTSQQANPDQGKRLYSERCAECHDENGNGTSEDPPVWGNSSFNDGAGLANTDRLAAWLKVSMPLNDTNLTEQESLDIAAFVNAQPRPKFRLRDHLPHPSRIGEYNGDTESD